MRQCTSVTDGQTDGHWLALKMYNYYDPQWILNLNPWPQLWSWNHDSYTYKKTSSRVSLLKRKVDIDRQRVTLLSTLPSRQTWSVKIDLILGQIMVCRFTCAAVWCRAGRRWEAKRVKHRCLKVIPQTLVGNMTGHVYVKWPGKCRVLRGRHCHYTWLGKVVRNSRMKRNPGKISHLNLDSWYLCWPFNAINICHCFLCLLCMRMFCFVIF